ncbi:hypothetical protein ACIBK9_50290 [Nonomuraea sp. NPDC050227]|uniref:hypothetical protein n=1 Tax=Nonomuraea sp. NPDC050227 TaxID=3364360 RepID=UPI0037A2E988
MVMAAHCLLLLNNIGVAFVVRRPTAFARVGGAAPARRSHIQQPISLTHHERAPAAECRDHRAQHGPRM